jgi:hypothetical protein
VAQLAHIPRPTIALQSQLGLQHALEDGGAVHLDKRPHCSRPAVVKDTCHQSLAGAGLTLEQHNGDVRVAEGVKRGKVADLRALGDNSGSRPDQAVGGMASGVQVGVSHGHASSG